MSLPLSLEIAQFPVRASITFASLFECRLLFFRETVESRFKQSSSEYCFDWTFAQNQLDGVHRILLDTLIPLDRSRGDWRSWHGPGHASGRAYRSLRQDEEASFRR